MKVFRKTGVSTLINILGMSVAFAAAMILMVQDCSLPISAGR